MRYFLLTTLLGVFLGLCAGYGLGEFQSHQMAWDPSLEVNKGVVIAQAGRTDDANGAASETNKSETAEAKKGQRGRQPRVKVDETEFDFGIVEKNPSSEKGEHLFYIENVGDADMTLADGGKGCFCTEFTISRSLIKPGEKATVKFMWDGARSGATFNQGIRVLTNDPDRKEVMFVVRGLYTSPLVCDLGEITMLNATTTQETSRSFRLMGFEKNEDGSPFPLEIERVEISDPEHFTVDAQREDLSSLTESDLKNKLFMQTQNLFHCVVTMKPGMPQGAFKENLRFYTNSPKMPYLDVVVSGQVIGNNVKVVGSAYDDKVSGVLKLDSVSQSVGKKSNLRITIFDRIHCDENTVKVKSVRPDWLKVTLTYPEEELQKSAPVRMIGVEVEVPPGSPQGAFVGPEKEQLGEFVVTIGESEESSQEVVIPVRFAVTP